MRKLAFVALAAAGVTLLALFVGRLAPSSGNASSHREAPLISEDPTADNTDLYAFRSPDKPDTLTIIANWIPGEDPAAGPNYYTFSQADSAKYLIYIDRNGDGKPDITWNFQFKTPYGPYFLGNTQQTWTAKRNDQVFATGKTPINNIGPRFNNFVEVKDYEATAQSTIVDEGRRLDLRRPARRPVLRRRRRDLRPGRDPQGGDDREQGRGQGLPVRLQRPHDRPADPDLAGRQQVAHDRRLGGDEPQERHRPRPPLQGLGAGLAPRRAARSTRSSSRPGSKDLWNRTTPQHDSQFKKYYETPILAAVLNKLYKLGVPETKRDDLVAVLGTGIPKVTYTGNDLRGRAADQPRDPASRRTRTGWACSAATTPASRTAAG